jgi:hypothetical protein
MNSYVGAIDTTTPSTMGAIEGSNYGGHAPIVASHVYLLQAGTSGYGGSATSLLGNNGNTTGLTANVNDPKIPTSSTWYYTTTDNTGSFKLGGYYTCTPGLPVYIYAWGGYPAIAPQSSITGYSVAGSTVTLTGYNLVYVGEQVTFSGMPVGAAVLNLGTYTVTSVPTSGVASFTVTATGVLGSGTNLTGAYVQPVQTNNANLVNLAVLGNCPTSGSANFSSLPYVYLNEVSTVAAAYSLSGFFSNSSTALASSDAVHLSIPAENGFGSTAWTGIENAANNAAQLYDTSGAVQGTSGDGESHIANSATLSGGVVPQALLNTMADVLATCTDSNSTASAISTACKTLFGYVSSTVQSGGVPSTTAQGGVAPVDTATAAIDMAHNPGNSNASKILALATGVVPYTPTVTSTGSKDLVIAINFPVPAAEQSGIFTNYQDPTNGVTQNVTLGSSAVDAQGNVWVGSYQYGVTQGNGNQSGYLMEYDPLGNQKLALQLGFTPQMEALDLQGNVWVVNNAYTGGGTTAIYEYSPSTGVLTSFNPAVTNPESVSIDGLGDVFETSYPQGQAVEINSLGQTSCTYSSNFNVFATAVDASNNFWLGTYAGPVQVYPPYTFSRTGGIQCAATPSYQAPNNVSQPQVIAFDQSGHAWVTQRTFSANNPISVINRTANTQTNHSGGNMYGATAAAVDGNGNVVVGNWVYSGNRATFTILNNAGTALTTGSGLTGNYTVNGGSAVTTTEGFWFYSLDASGNLWSNGNNYVHEYIGVAAPVKTPLVQAVADGALAEKP